MLKSPVFSQWSLREGLWAVILLCAAASLLAASLAGGHDGGFDSFHRAGLGGGGGAAEAEMEFAAAVAEIDGARNARFDPLAVARYMAPWGFGTWYLLKQQMMHDEDVNVPGRTPNGAAAAVLRKIERMRWHVDVGVAVIDRGWEDPYYGVGRFRADFDPSWLRQRLRALGVRLGVKVDLPFLPSHHHMFEHAVVEGWCVVRDRGRPPASHGGRFASLRRATYVSWPPENVADGTSAPVLEGCVLDATQASVRRWLEAQFEELWQLVDAVVLSGAERAVVSGDSGSRVDLANATGAYLELPWISAAAYRAASDAALRIYPSHGFALMAPGREPDGTPDGLQLGPIDTSYFSCIDVDGVAEPAGPRGGRNAGHSDALDDAYVSVVHAATAGHLGVGLTLDLDRMVRFSPTVMADHSAPPTREATLNDTRRLGEAVRTMQLAFHLPVVCLREWTALSRSGAPLPATLGDAAVITWLRGLAQRHAQLSAYFEGAVATALVHRIALADSLVHPHDAHVVPLSDGGTIGFEELLFDPSIAIGHVPRGLTVWPTLPGGHTFRAPCAHTEWFLGRDLVISPVMSILPLVPHSLRLPLPLKGGTEVDDSGEVATGGDGGPARGANRRRRPQPRAYCLQCWIDVDDAAAPPRDALPRAEVAEGDPEHLAEAVEGSKDDALFRVPLHRHLVFQRAASVVPLRLRARHLVLSLGGAIRRDGRGGGYVPLIRLSSGPLSSTGTAPVVACRNLSNVAFVERRGGQGGAFAVMAAVCDAAEDLLTTRGDASPAALSFVLRVDWRVEGALPAGTRAPDPNAPSTLLSFRVATAQKQSSALPGLLCRCADNAADGAVAAAHHDCASLPAVAGRRSALRRSRVADAADGLPVIDVVEDEAVWQRHEGHLDADAERRGADYRPTVCVTSEVPLRNATEEESSGWLPPAHHLQRHGVVGLTLRLPLVPPRLSAASRGSVSCRCTVRG